MSSPHNRQKLLKTRLDRFTRSLDGVEAGDVRAIHRTRVATRRLREVLPVLQLGGHAADKLGRRLRRATRRLGDVRELDVLLHLIDEMRRGGQASSQMLGQIAGEVKHARKEAQEERAGKPLVLELRRIARKLTEAVDEVADGADGHQRERGWRWAIDARIMRRAEILNEAVSGAGALYFPKRLHDVRIALKKLRYAVEVAAEATGEDHRLELATLKRGQNTLGRLHDLQVLIDRVRHSQACLKTPDLAVWREFDAVLTGLEKACRRLHARYLRERSAFLAICVRHSGRTPRAKSAVRRAG